MKRKGVSLLELMTAVIILSVLASIAVPNYQRMQRRHEWLEAYVVLDVVYKGVRYYYDANNMWPPDQSWNWLNASCADINAYLVWIGAGQVQVPLTACDKFTYDLYGGGPTQCTPSTQWCYIGCSRKDGVAGYMTKHLITGEIVKVGI